ncbi:MAG: peroxidase-related enzyme [Acidobacteria bacterium]|nr:peroxidase-related enzyme [Acidobacteriota bacterium]
MAFIATIPEDYAPDDVKQMYAQNLEKQGYIPNYSRVFSHRPQVMEAWGNLLRAIKGNLDMRRFELATLAAARALKNSYCSLAHGSILRQKFYSSEQLTLIAKDYRSADLTPAEIAMMAYAEQIARDASAVTENQIQDLRDHGFSDAEIFDIATTAAARCFFAKTLDALGAEPDEIYWELEESLRQTLTVGRPIVERR